MRLINGLINGSMAHWVMWEVGCMCLTKMLPKHASLDTGA